MVALCDASLEGNPQLPQRCRQDTRYLDRRHPGIEYSNSDEEDDTPHVKIPPPIFKGLPGE